ncbi:MAG: Rieske (2Fe-2S) protein [Planctomycetaceae bacterium]|nr:Rieske (2Fe-2S) protein [Planctomycetaceae bacterium]
MSQKKSCCSCSDLGTGEVRRRGFLGLLFGLVGGAIAFAAPIFAAVCSVIFPWVKVRWDMDSRKLTLDKVEGIGGKDYFLTTLDQLSETPQKFPIIDDVVDAWVTVPRQTIGNVYVRKTESGEVLAWQALCPHAGCVLAVKTTANPKTKNAELLFTCPCHVAHFDLDGNLLDEKPDSPRDMDSLETKIEDGKVYVKFQNFQFGIPTKTPS